MITFVKTTVTAVLTSIHCKCLYKMPSKGLVNTYRWIGAFGKGVGVGGGATKHLTYLFPLDQIDGATSD